MNAPFPARPRASLYGMRYAAVTGHHLASRAAAVRLESGGSLIDAMIAASAVLTVALPHATSLGGCAMMLHYHAGRGELTGLNGSGHAPAAARPGLFPNGIDPRGPRSWVVPGLVRFWARAHQSHGLLPWRTLFSDAIELAGHGLGFGSELARNLALAGAEVRAQPGFAQAFTENGADRKVGTPWRQPALAETLRQIAEEGETAFYHGDIARRLACYASEQGALLTREDLADSRADWVAPVWQDHGRWQVGVMPPNSVGVLMQAQLAHLRPAYEQPREERLYAQIVAASRLLPGLRDRVADPGAAWPWEETADGIRPASAGPQRGDPGDTAGIVLADASGNGLAMLQSVFQPFGSGCVDPATGILMNNRLGEFSLTAGQHNLLAPGKRPVHTLNPYVVAAGGKPALYAVSPGGVSQTTTGVQCLFNALLDDMRLPQAIDAPRWSLSRDGKVMCEPGFPADVVRRLRERGMEVATDSLHPFYFGSVKAVRPLPGGMLEAAADLRREACALAW
ncbi:gamma-glutamyltransferase family protein [Bordetella petrii]|uniref:gamma-glutamyltransferase family protein n=1 Tax=Bordetella petrii TaxID=94624 RepID=UPI001E4396D6|nr:gamma-glutamyltransferase [Bordetella petrii]MCD0505923.1 gamma-glutamyltransferase [Bordetella petrii]